MPFDLGGWGKCTGAGWPLTHNRPPARCHCAAKPEGRPCYPLKRACPVAPPWCDGDRVVQFLPCINFSSSPVLRPQGVHPIGVPKWEPNGNPAQAISIGRGRVAEGASLALSGETSIWSLRGRDWSVRGRGSQGEGGIETPLPLSGLLVTFAPWQKSLAAAAAKHPPEIKYTAPQGHQCTGRAGRGETPLPPKFSSPVTFWTQYYGCVTLAPNPLTSVGVMLR